MKRKSQAIILGAATFGCLLMLPLGAVGALASPMLFDDPHNLESPVAWIAFMLVLSLWIICIAAPYGAWVAYAKRREPLQWLAIGAPFAWCAVTALSLMLAKV
jgi:uncharacterized BrkB/YihY/UPF0761 family membrane protein